MTLELPQVRALEAKMTELMENADIDGVAQVGLLVAWAVDGAHHIGMTREEMDDLYNMLWREKADA